MGVVTAATAAAGLAGTVLAKKKFIDQPKKMKDAYEADKASTLAANKIAADELAKKNAEEKKAAAGASEKTLADTQQSARASALNDMLIGEGDESQRRKFLRGAK
jgi:hypothetical protein